VEYRRNEIVTGLFVVLAAAVFALFAFRVGRFDLLGLFRGDVLPCKAYFTDVKTLKPGQPVKVGGQPVGEVTEVRMVERALTERQVRALRDLNEHKATQGLTVGMMRQVIEVGFELSQASLKLNPVTARVSLGQESLLSSHFLELDPGEWTADQVPLSILEARRGDAELEPVVVETIESSGYEELVALVKPVVREFDNTLKIINQSVLSQGNLEALRRILSNVDAAIGRGRKIAGRIDSLLDRVHGELLSAENTEAFGSTLADLQGAAKDVRSLGAHLEQLFNREKGSRVQTIVERVSEAADSLDERLDALQRDLHETLATTTAILQENRGEIAEITRRLRRALWHTELAARKVRLNPSMLLFGDDEKDFAAEEMDASQIRYSGRVEPYGQREEAGE